MRALSSTLAIIVFLASLCNCQAPIIGRSTAVSLKLNVGHSPIISSLSKQTSAYSSRVLLSPGTYIEVILANASGKTYISSVDTSTGKPATVLFTNIPVGNYTISATAYDGIGKVNALFTNQINATINPTENIISLQLLPNPDSLVTYSSGVSFSPGPNGYVCTKYVLNNRADSLNFNFRPGLSPTACYFQDSVGNTVINHKTYNGSTGYTTYTVPQNATDGVLILTLCFSGYNVSLTIIEQGI